MTRATWLAAGALALVGSAVGTAAYLHYHPALDAAAPASAQILDADQRVVGTYTPPPLSSLASGKDAQAVMLGKRLLNDTARLLPDNVGNGLNCNSCHMAQGRQAYGNHYMNATAGYPRYMPRPGKAIDLAQRINGCFQRSMNGKPLPVDSREMHAMQAYMAWVGTGVPHGAHVATVSEGPVDTSLQPDPARGVVIYASRCAACHGDDGQGLKDQFGDYIFPPLWGDDSFNIGAGMARLYKAAAFVKHNMPVAVTREPPLGQGRMSDQDAVDVAWYFTRKPRPDFPGKVNDWPRDKKPKDARY